MLTLIDWISFSIPMDTDRMSEERDAPGEIVRSLLALDDDLPEWLALDEEFEARNGRAPYRTSWARHDDGLRLFTHPALPHALIEISGRGCARLAADGFLDDVLRAVLGRLTRIDIACDIKTDTRPMEFAEDRESGRFKSVSYVHSESGETFYVGAKTSDRYCRVYRYNPPHERSALLRVEFVVKAENARLTAEAVLAQGLRPVVAALGNSFGWRHADWKLDDEHAELAVYRPDRKQGKTLYWLADTIAPLLARLHRDGVLDVDAWIVENVKPLLKN